MHRPQIWAHRGARRAAPENTLPAFQRALDMGADELAATGGEDYELLIACPTQSRERAEAAAQSAATQLTWVGEAERGSDVTLLDADGAQREWGGWDHLEPAAAHEDRRPWRASR